MLRKTIERAIEDLLARAEALIAAIDRIDGDPDLELGADLEAGGDREPALGWSTAGGAASPWSSPGGVGVDFED